MIHLPNLMRRLALPVAVVLLATPALAQKPKASKGPKAAKAQGKYEHVEIVNGDTVRHIVSDDPIEAMEAPPAPGAPGAPGERWAPYDPEAPRAPRPPREPRVLGFNDRIKVDSLGDDIRIRVESLRDRNWREPIIYMDGNEGRLIRRPRGPVWREGDVSVYANTDEQVQVETKDYGKDSTETVIRIRQPKAAKRSAEAMGPASVGLKSLETWYDEAGELHIRLESMYGGRGGSALRVQVLDNAGKSLYDYETRASQFEHTLSLPKDAKGDLQLRATRDGNTYERSIKR